MADDETKGPKTPLSDIGEWGDRPQCSYERPLVIFGETIDLSEASPFGRR